MTERSVFLAVLELDEPAERAAYLDRACAGDPVLRGQVDRLLQAHQDTGAFMERPAAGDFLESVAPGSVTTVEEAGLERPGIVIGPYKLMEQIGEGGMGRVFVAEQQHPVRRKVALKLIKPGMDTCEVIARFEAERQALALMDHPNIARVFDAGATESGRPYFVMELVRGVGITEFCDQNRLTPRERLELFVHVCQAVQHAHHKGIIHRDLKSTNILVTLHDGTPVVKVIDFGVAKAIGQQLTEKTIYTAFAQMIGTPMYMSPEQAEMSGLDIDTRSDIYSLGVLLYELLTGTTPFDKERLRTVGYDELRRIIREEEPPRPSTRFSTLGQGSATVSANRRSEPKRLSQLFRGELDWIVMKALEKDRTRRYETASGFAADVQRYLHDEPVHACPPTVGYRLRKIVRRNRRAALVVSLVVLALVGGIIGTTWGMLRATVEAKQKDEALTDRETALEEARQSERDAKDSLWLSLYEQARARRFSRQMGQRLESLDALAKAAALRPDERLRDEAIAAMALPDVRYGPTWQAACPPGSQSWAFDAQFRLYARASDKGVISIRSLPDDKEIKTIVCDPAKVSGLWFSPDGRYLARLLDGCKLRVWRVADGESVLREEPRQTYGWAFSPDSRHLVVGQQGWILRFDLASGRELNRWQLAHNIHAYTLALNPDNCKVAVGYARSNVASVYNAASGALITDLPVGAITESVVAWDPDGRRLAVTGSLVNPVIQIWDVAAKRKVAMLPGHSQRVTYLSFQPDGDLLASASWDGTVRLWNPSSARQLMQLPIHALPQFSGDGRWLGVVMHGEQAQLLEMTTTREYRTLVSSLGAGQGESNLDSDISPDGQLLAQAMNDAVRLWHLSSGRELAVLPPGRPLFQSNSELLIAGHGGLHRWPIQPGAAANELRLGPPRTVALPAMPIRAARSRDGRTLAIVSETQGTGLLVDLATDSVRAPRLGHPKASFVAHSPDGRWLASGGWHSDRVRLWNAATGMMVHEWVQTGSAMVCFTPDSRVLIISRWDEFAFHDVETLKPIRRIRRDVSIYPGHVAFSPDGGLMALEMAPGVIHLKDAATAKTVAKLEDPHGDRAGWLSFTPDGTQLVVTAPYARAVHIWDLRAIRQRLKGMGLDWAWPEFKSAGERRAPPADPPKVSVVGAERIVDWTVWRNRAISHTAAKRWSEAVASYSKAVELNPDDMYCWNQRGVAHSWLGQKDRALADYAKAIELNPADPLYWCNRGSAYGQLGQYDKAVADYTKAIELKSDNAAIWSNRAGCYAELGQWKEATADYARAVELNKDDAPLRYRQALARLQLGDVIGYRKFCTDMLGQFGSAAKPEAAPWTVWTCVLAADAVADWKALLQLAEKAVAGNPKDYRALSHHGAALYRAGQYQEAIKRLAEAEAAYQPADEKLNANAYNWLFLTMAHQRLGHIEEVKKWLDKAVQSIDREMPKNPKDSTAANPSIWNRRLTLQLLRREAEELLRKKDQ